MVELINCLWKWPWLQYIDSWKPKLYSVMKLEIGRKLAPLNSSPKCLTNTIETSTYYNINSMDIHRSLTDTCKLCISEWPNKESKYFQRQNWNLNWLLHLHVCNIKIHNILCTLTLFLKFEKIYKMVKINSIMNFLLFCLGLLQKNYKCISLLWEFFLIFLRLQCTIIMPTDVWHNKERYYCFKNDKKQGRYVQNQQKKVVQI